MDTFGRYLETISRWPLLTPAQEIELARLKQAGIEVAERIGTRKPTRRELRAIKTGQRSIERIITCNLRLVVSIAKNYVNNCSLHDIEDLVQYGSIGLKRAAERFDHEKGYKFSTYASWWIRQEIQRGIYKADQTIRIPEHCRLIWARLRRHANALLHELGRTPTSEEIMQAANVSKIDFMLITRAMERAISLNNTLQGGNEMIDFIPDNENGSEIALDCGILIELVEMLPDNDRNLVKKRFGIGEYAPHSYIELGKQYGISRQGAKDRLDKIQARIKSQLFIKGA